MRQLARVSRSSAADSEDERDDVNGRITIPGFVRLFSCIACIITTIIGIYGTGPEGGCVSVPSSHIPFYIHIPCSMDREWWHTILHWRRDFVFHLFLNHFFYISICACCLLHFVLFFCFLLPICTIPSFRRRKWAIQRGNFKLGGVPAKGNRFSVNGKG
jgi:hypothetical protein